MPRRTSINARSCGVEHDDGAAQRHLLRHGELRVPGSRRHVDHHHIERAPLDLAQHLGQCRHHHRAAPDHRRLLLDEEADRHHLEAIAVHRDEPRTALGLRFALEGEQLGDRRTVDIGIEHADPQAEIAKPERQVDRRRRFADAALAGCDRDDRIDARHADRAMRARCAAAAAAGEVGRWPRPACGRAAPAARSAVSATMAETTPGIALTAASASLAHRLPRLHHSCVHRDRKEHLAVGDDDVGQRIGPRQRHRPAG